jgi:hypothetical protein
MPVSRASPCPRVWPHKSPSPEPEGRRPLLPSLPEQRPQSREQTAPRGQGGGITRESGRMIHEDWHWCRHHAMGATSSGWDAVVGGTTTSCAPRGVCRAAARDAIDRAGTRPSRRRFPDLLRSPSEQAAAGEAAAPRAGGRDRERHEVTRISDAPNLRRARQAVAAAHSGGSRQCAKADYRRRGADSSPAPHQKFRQSGLSMERMKGFEPSTFCMASRRSSQLSYIRPARGL